ncbi:serine/threonine-protein kinase [Nocardiopsis sp. MG754419]|uniref:serine/threonine protein kinase n=1 Tax=Nocardiopsis sp. MG754419 TaxID=2259865 RepID=UPI001BA60C9A|nr:serine/threonine-protein kinase [Nocardiopsis sp. MG754419]MBR8743574.1 serine/threonine protein kinase [Nocardiopsis sp. MG754419]
MSDSAPAPSWAPGYNVAEQLRQGNRARIVRATRTTSGADVVLKVLSSQAGRNELDRLRELSGVPGVVPLLDAGATTTGDMFVVLPYYRDGSFADMLARMGPAPIEEAAGVARSISVALGSLHARGLTHNDVSPGNILRAGRTPVLSGFGSVQPAGRPLPSPPANTEAFLHAPPEALRGQPLGPMSDVYRLASTVWTMLVGRAPFSSTDGSPFDPHTYADRVFNETPPPVSRQDVSRKIRGVLTRALAKQPEERYPTTAEFSAAFEQARTSRPATTVAGSTGGNFPPTEHAGTGGQASRPPTGPRPPLSGPQTPPTRTPAPPSGPQSSLSGAQRPSTEPGRQLAPSPSVSGADSWFPPEPGEVSPVQHTTGGDSLSRLESTGRLRHPARELPTPEERERQGAVPLDSPNTTADIAMARLRGQEISPLVLWSRLEGWTGDAEDAYLPVDEVTANQNPESEWNPSVSDDPTQPRWREHLHIAVTVCGILLVTVVAGAFAATGSPEPVTAAAEEQTEVEPVEEAPAEPVAQPSPLPEVTPASQVSLDDTLSAVTVTWTDHTGGTGSYFVVGGRQGHDLLTLARTGPGAMTAQIPTDDTQAEYCFVVVAVDGGSAPSDEVCTTRAAERAAEAERLAEEEAEAEEEEEEEEEDEEDAAPSPSPSPNAGD